MDISPRSTDYVVDDPSWLGSEHGYEAARTGTLDASLFTPATHYPDGFIPSGTPLGLVTATKLYGPYKADASDGRETLVGHLKVAKEVRAADAKIGCAILDHGKVRESRLPFPVDAAGKADVAGRIQYV